MFGDLDAPVTWSIIGVFVTLIALLWTPVILLLLLATAFFLAPVAFVGLPFLLWAFLGGTQAEFEAERQRAEARPRVRHLRTAH
jgi:hypothetical protein